MKLKNAFELVLFVVFVSFIVFGSNLVFAAGIALAGGELGYLAGYERGWSACDKESNSAVKSSNNEYPPATK